MTRKKRDRAETVAQVQVFYFEKPRKTSHRSVTPPERVREPPTRPPRAARRPLKRASEQPTLPADEDEAVTLTESPCSEPLPDASLEGIPVTVEPCSEKEVLDYHREKLQELTNRGAKGRSLANLALFGQSLY